MDISSCFVLVSQSRYNRMNNIALCGAQTLIISVGTVGCVFGQCANLWTVIGIVQR